MSVKMKEEPSQRAATCDDMEEGGVNQRSPSLRCACHSCDWPSCPPVGAGLKDAHQYERACWGVWAHRTGVGVAVGAPSPPPGGLYMA